MEPAKRHATYQDVLNAPPNKVAEVIFGQLVLSPRPARRHGRAASILGMDLGAAFERGRSGPGGWVIFDEPELHLSRDILVPERVATGTLPGGGIGGSVLHDPVGLGVCASVRSRRARARRPMDARAERGLTASPAGSPVKSTLWTPVQAARFTEVRGEDAPLPYSAAELRLSCTNRRSWNAFAASGST